MKNRKFLFLILFIYVLPTTPFSSIPPVNTFPECSFSTSTCEWVNGDFHTWRRTRVSDLNAEGYDGPKEDHDGNNED